MLLLHQAGHVKVGEVVRYTLTYTPSDDRILPSASALQVRIKNTTAIPYRAAYLHGPYTLHVATYPAHFNPYKKLENPRRDGVPEFEPMLKAGGHFHSKLTVPEDMRLSGRSSPAIAPGKGKQRSVTWIIEIASQVLFSKSASVHYEILVGRDERSLDLGFAAIAGKGHGGPGQLQDLLRQPTSLADRKKSPQKGVYSEAVELSAEDTEQLWNKPALPTWDDIPGGDKDSKPAESNQIDDRRPQKKIHLVVLTHGIHSNVGADMLFMKESIDATVRQAREAQRAERAKSTREKRNTGTEERAARQNTGDDEEVPSTAPLSGGQEDIEEETHADFDPDDEQVIVRGFSGNTTKTEKGIKYLGKRLAKYILAFTYPDQPFLPESKSLAKKFSMGPAGKRTGDPPAHTGSTIHQDKHKHERLPYTFTSISFVGHSLGGLVQTYAVAYIQKHSPEFFEKITPVNFVCMASPMLGLSNENPLYVKFALDFGLVGRTGQDLGLTWRAPAIAKTGWASVLSSFGAGAGEDKQKAEDPGAKPLLRILPTGPAHQVLKKFRNRTTYSNVVNDGIVPLRTSCLLFLDWRGLNRVEAARRENGLLATMASVGWAELTGANVVSHRPQTSGSADQDFFEDNKGRKSASHDEDVGPKNESRHDSLRGQFAGMPDSPQPKQTVARRPPIATPSGSLSSLASNNSKRSTEAVRNNTASPFAEFLNFFRPSPARKDSEKTGKVSSKARKTYRRAQTLRKDNMGDQSDSRESVNDSPEPAPRPIVTRGSSLVETEDGGPPPKTSVFDAAADILNPPIPPLSWLTDPSSRDRSIFHDRIYHPDDIPPPPPKKAKTTRSFSSDGLKRGNSSAGDRPHNTIETDAGSMKVEEKIARAYHHNLSWRKVLVRLEPDAHNNMIVRRMFANAYGWEVVKHVCDTHFSDSVAAQTADELESSQERAKNPSEPVGDDGVEVHKEEKSNARPTLHDRTKSELQESGDAVAELSRPHAHMNSSGPGSSSTRRSSESDAKSSFSRSSSAVWDDKLFEGSGSEDDSDEEQNGPLDAFKKIWNGEGRAGQKNKEDLQLDTSAEVTGLSADPQVAAFLTTSPAKAKPGELDRAEEVVNPTYQAGLAAVESQSNAATFPRPASSETTAEPGLHKSIPDSIGEATSPNPQAKSRSIAENVARAAHEPRP